MPDFLNHFKGFSPLMLTAVTLTGCFSDPGMAVTSSGDAETGSESGSTSDTSDETGSSETTGTDTTDGTDSTSMDTGTSGETDTGNPCDESATPQWVADQLMEDCALLFGDSACMADEALTRAEFIANVVVSYGPEDLLLCYEDPVMPHFPADVPDNHPAYQFIEKAFFLGVITEAPFFEPDEMASVCWADEVLMVWQDLPDIIVSAESGQTDGNFGVGVGPVLVTRYSLCGTNMEEHLDFPVTVVNNLDGDFTMPEATDAVQDIRLRCATPDETGYIPTAYYFLPGGEADIGMLDCYHDAGGPLELQIQVRTGDPGQFRLGLDPETIAIFGDGYIPLYTVQ